MGGRLLSATHAQILTGGLVIGLDLWRGRSGLWLLQSAWRHAPLSATSAAVAGWCVHGSLALIGDQLTFYCLPGHMCSWLSCVVWLIYISACCGLFRIVCLSCQASLISLLGILNVKVAGFVASWYTFRTVWWRLATISPLVTEVA